MTDLLDLKKLGLDDGQTGKPTDRAGRKKLESVQSRTKTKGPRRHPLSPRVSRLMALAIHFGQLIRDGGVADYADRRSVEVMHG